MDRCDDALLMFANPLVTFRHEQGIEAFYNCAVTNWFLVTGDVQYVNPALGNSDNAFIGGLRATMRF